MQLFRQKLILVHGKGGVGKTTLSMAIARKLAETSRVLWVAFEDPLREPGETRKPTATLTEINCVPEQAFEEYLGIKLGGGAGASAIVKVFAKNPLIRYLAQAAPGIRELVLLGKVWFETRRPAESGPDHVVVDMPSTGYALAMFQSAANFSKLFGGGPIQRDADAILETMGDAKTTRHLIVSLAEEMPLQESIELRDHLSKLFPANPPEFVVNRVLRETASPGVPSAPYLTGRRALEHANLRKWDEAGIQYSRLPYFPPPESLDRETIQRETTAQVARALEVANP